MKIKELIKNPFKKTFYGWTPWSSQTIRPNWNSTKYLTAYETSLYVYACVRKRAEIVGQMEFKMLRGEAEIKENEYLNLLYKPNPNQNKNEFLELFQIYKDLFGSSFIYLLRPALNAKAQELYVLRPDWVSTIVGKETGMIEGYKYSVKGNKPITFPKEDIIASHYASPLQQYQGQSPLKAGGLSVDTEEQLAEYQYNVLKNGGKIEGIVNFKAEYLTEKQLDELKQKWQEQYATAKKSGRPLFLYGGAEYQNLGLSPTELSFIESKRLTRDDILLLYGVPKAIVAQTDDVNLANAKMAKTIFLGETIKPLMDNITQKFNEFLVPEPFVLDYVDPTPEDAELELKKIENGIQNYYLTPNEARKRIGLEPIEGGDELLIPWTLRGFDLTTENETKTKRKSQAHPLSNKEMRRKYHADYIKRADKREMLFLSALKAYWQGQLERLTSKLEIEKSKKKDLLDDFFDMRLEVDLAQTAFYPILEEILKQAGIETSLFIGAKTPFDLRAAIISSLKKRIEFFAEAMNKTTFENLVEAFAESVEAGESRKDLIKRIQKVYNGYSKSRAQTIARTEVQIASQQGNYDAYKQAGVGIKIWVAVLDERTRDSHVDLDGEEVPIDIPFSNGLMHPGDPNGSAEEVINCRCTI